MVKLDVSIQGKEEIEKFLLFGIIGLLDSLKEGLVTIKECEIYLFCPYCIKKLKKKNIDDKILNLLWDCCELEEIASLMPDKYISELLNLKYRAMDLLSILDYKDLNFQHWID